MLSSAPGRAAGTRALLLSTGLLCAVLKLDTKSSPAMGMLVLGKGTKILTLKYVGFWEMQAGNL